MTAYSERPIMEPDFYKVMRELVEWAETPSGALVVYPAMVAVGVALGYCCHRIKKGYQKYFSEPERKPFEGIPTQKLPKSEP